MDPDATYADLTHALLRGDEETAAELAIALAAWIRSGGYPPDALVNRGA